MTMLSKPRPIANDSKGNSQFRVGVYFSGAEEVKLYQATRKFVFNQQVKYQGAFGFSTVIKIALREHLIRHKYLKKQ